MTPQDHLEDTPDASLDRAQAAGAQPAGQAQVLMPRLSLVVVGCGVLILVSLLVPYFEPPFGGDLYMRWLSGGTALLGTLAFLRREGGEVATIARVVTLCSASLFVFTFVFPWVYSLAAGVLMPN